MGDLNIFRHLLPYTDTGTTKEIPEISRPRSDIPVQGTAIRFVPSSLGVHCSSKGGKTDGHTQVYKDPTVPRRLVGESQIPPLLSRAYTGSSKNVSTTWLACELGKIRTGTQAGFRLCRLPVRPQVQSGPTHYGPVAESSTKNTETAIPTGLCGPGTHVLDRFIDSHRKASSSGLTSYETHTVSFEKQLEGSGITRKSDPNSQVPAPPFAMVANRRPIKHALQIFTDA